MKKRKTYNLRERKLSPQKVIPKPQIGDQVSIFWEALNKQYEGTLIKFDKAHRTFLVDYDDIPEGYDDNQIWEDLDFAPWRILERFEQRKHRRIRKSARNSSTPSGNDQFGVKDDGKSSRWFQPGELSSAHSQFCAANDGRWYRRKRKKKLNGICDRGSESSEEGDEKVNVPESEGDEEGSGNSSQEENEEILKVHGGYHFVEETCSQKFSAEGHREKKNIPQAKKRRYPNFGALGFSSVPKNLFADVAHPCDDFQAVPCFAQDTIRINCSRNSATEELSKIPVGSNETKQSSAFFLHTGNHIVHPCKTTKDSNCQPTVEEQIRCITKTFGLSAGSQYMNSD